MKHFFQYKYHDYSLSLLNYFVDQKTIHRQTNDTINFGKQ